MSHFQRGFWGDVVRAINWHEWVVSSPRAFCRGCFVLFLLCVWCDILGGARPACVDLGTQRVWEVFSFQVWCFLSFTIGKSQRGEGAGRGCLDDINKLMSQNSLFKSDWQFLFLQSPLRPLASIQVQHFYYQKLLTRSNWARKVR